MTKHDILNMQSKFDIMKTLKSHPELWDDEVNEHLISVARQYLLDRFGDADILHDPPRKEKKKSPGS